MTPISKEEILEKIKTVGTTDGRNSMGVSESYYDPYYLAKKCFKIEQLEAMSESELQNIIKMADFATEVFY